MTRGLLLYLHELTVEMYGDALREFLYSPLSMHCITPRDYILEVIINRIFQVASLCPALIPLKQHTFSRNNITMFCHMCAHILKILFHHSFLFLLQIQSCGVCVCQRQL